jgi:hypothetical protein
MRSRNNCGHIDKIVVYLYCGAGLIEAWVLRSKDTSSTDSRHLSYRRSPAIMINATALQRRARFLNSYLRRSRPRTCAKQFQAEFKTGLEYAGPTVRDAVSLAKILRSLSSVAFQFIWKFLRRWCDLLQRNSLPAPQVLEVAGSGRAPLQVLGIRSRRLCGVPFPHPLAGRGLARD